MPRPDHTSHLVLVGPMGVGKTTVGHLVAERLGRPLRDSDADLDTIHHNARQMAAEQGVEVLHRIEADLLLDALAVDQPLVIAAAGSVVDDERALEALERPGPTVVWLTAPLPTLVARVTEGDHRRDLGDDPAAAVAELAGRRDPLYRRIADAAIDVSERSPEDTVHAVLAALAETDSADPDRRAGADPTGARFDAGTPG